VKKATHTKKIGDQGEKLALNFLIKKKFSLVQRNYHSRYGEIDLIMKNEELLIFVEVRLRSSQNFGGALASVDYRKQAKLIKCAQYYLLKHPTKLNLRFDVIAISPLESQHEIQWVPNAFDEF